MVDGDKPPKDKRQASDPEGSNIDQYDPLFLHSNETSRVPLINFKLEAKPTEEGFKSSVFKNAKVVWDELEETYSKLDAYVIFNMHYKIHSLSQSRSTLSEYYHSLNFFNNDENESRSSDPYNDGRDKESKNSEGIDHISYKDTKNTGVTRRDESEHPDDSEPSEAVIDIEENETLDENTKESEGDDKFYQEFNEMFEKTNVVPDSQSVVNPRRSSRKTSMPKKFSDFKVDTKVKYSIDKQVNYSNISLENSNFSTSLNKIVEPITFDKALKDIRWVEAINLEMDALNKNGTWVITELFIRRKPIGKVVDTDYPLTGINGYQKLVEKLIYLTHTRPNISYVVHVLSQFMHAPLQLHLKLAFRVLRYLKNALGKGISFNKCDDLSIRTCVDSDWAQCKVTRKSVTGYAIFIGKSLVSWKSKKQSMLSKSSVEAEYKVMNNVTCEVI
uniref:Ribonuclease H-like domain-containing protein n=1 Tax=Tanacetum cinerariifolium TaxID=118510 RepID=A0A699GIT3_TANCI|nr:ribonuclease H-like domain-containing protein [Tanacetum cinerariifolium]